MRIRGGIVQWGTAGLFWDGANVYVDVSSFVEPWPVAWLQDKLAERLQAALNMPDFKVEMEPAIPSANGFAETGRFVLGPFHAPFRDVKVIHDIIDEAVRDAIEASKLADQESRDWLTALRQPDWSGWERRDLPPSD